MKEQQKELAPFRVSSNMIEPMIQAAQDQNRSWARIGDTVLISMVEGCDVDPRNYWDGVHNVMHPPKPTLNRIGRRLPNKS